MSTSTLLRQGRGALEYLAHTAPDVTIPTDLDRNDDEVIMEWVDEAATRARRRGLGRNALDTANSMANVLAEVALFQIAWHDTEAVAILVAAMSDDRLRVVTA
ncbi:hypothetical protein FAM19024_002408 [Propionibacterium freudenreichii]|uniref:hypothetical protein n=1 Tax=Propionibacterium freudenreichii TaxID=1744 RepID=UPI0024341B1B|nr:hypothetical protein [Propionibacterium freudenreichii]WFF32860.1 hypothetical protein FAM19024_002408 [Propionibacterium freudenreichii]